MYQARHIPTSKNRHYGGGKSSERTIKELLQGAGYSDAEIKRLRDEARVILVPGNFGAKVKGTQELYVLLHTAEEEGEPQKPIDRFARLDLE